MRRGRGIRRRVRRAKGYDWITTDGDQLITLLDPAVSETLAEFPLITSGEVSQLGEPILVERVVGEVHLTAPFRSGEVDGAAIVTWGIRTVDTDAQPGPDVYLPADPATSDGMDASWMFLRQHVLGNVGVPQFQSLPLNFLPQVAAGGRHAPQGGPAFDINVKRKMRDTQVLTLSVSVHAFSTWSGSIIEDYHAGDEVGILLHVRALVCPSGR